MHGCAGSILGTLDERGLLRHGPGCTPLGAVAAVTAVRDLVGTLTAVLTPEGAVLGVDLEPVGDCRVGADGTIWSTPEGDDESWSGGAVLGFSQGLPPPLGLLAASDGRAGVVQWNDQRVRLEGCDWVGWWQSNGAGGVVDGDGADLEPGLVFALPRDGPAEDLPQAVDVHGLFLGHVLPSRAVIGREGTQVSTSRWPWRHTAHYFTQCTSSTSLFRMLSPSRRCSRASCAPVQGQALRWCGRCGGFCKHVTSLSCADSSGYLRTETAISRLCSGRVVCSCAAGTIRA